MLPIPTHLFSHWSIPLIERSQINASLADFGLTDYIVQNHPDLPDTNVPVLNLNDFFYINIQSHFQSWYKATPNYFIKDKKQRRQFL
jgi:hypothetical protein